MEDRDLKLKKGFACMFAEIDSYTILSKSVFCNIRGGPPEAQCPQSSMEIIRRGRLFHVSAYTAQPHYKIYVCVLNSYSIHCHVDLKQIAYNF
jgi:hypothetical protein